MQTETNFSLRTGGIFFIRTCDLWLVHLSLSYPFPSIMRLFCVNGKEFDKLLMVLSFSPFQMINDNWFPIIVNPDSLMLDRVEVFAGISNSKGCNLILWRIVMIDCLFINNPLFIIKHFCRPSNRLCIYYCCHNGGIADKLQLERFADVLPVRMVTSLAATPRDHGRHQQWRQFVGGSSPASGASSTTLGVSRHRSDNAIGGE